MQDRYVKFIHDLALHLEDIDWLSKAAITLSTLLYNHNSDMAQAQLAENRALVALLDTPTDTKKMSFSEAEARAIIQTNNSYKGYKVTAEAIVETINAIKKRLDVLALEYKSGGGR